VRVALSVLAATLAVAAGTGCTEKRQASSTAGTSGTAVTAPNGATATRPAAPPDQSRWAKQVDDACRGWQQKIDAANTPPTDAASLERWLERVLPLVREQIAAVKAVKPPVKQEEARNARLFLSSFEQVERALTRYLSAVRADAPAKVRRALTDASAAGAATRAYAVSLDITQCGGYSSS
jgi:hypothetical protein